MVLAYGTRTKGICTVSGCGKPRVCRGLCNGHYWRLRTRKPGEISFEHKKPRPTGGPAKDFLLSALRSNTSECIIWPYAKTRGYALAHIDGKMRRLHRWICRQHRGEPPSDEYHAAHRCGVRSCINKRHIRWRTIQQNIDEKLVHGRPTRGERIVQHKLTEVEALRVFNSKEPTRILAVRYGVSVVTINRIRGGKYGGWNWLTKNRRSKK